MMNWEMFLAACLVYLIPVVFLALAVFIYRPWAKHDYQRYARSLFDDQDNGRDQRASDDDSFLA